MRPLAVLLVVFLAGCALDVNGYRAKGGSTGPVHCHGACR